MADKTATRAIAERLGLGVASKPDSQDICFVPSGSYADLVARLRPDAALPGDIVSQDGRVLGQHQGVARYTIGQARRLGMAASDGAQAQVVVDLQPATRRVVVGPRSTGTRRLRLREMNWLIDRPDQGVACTVKLRARDTLRRAFVTPSDGGADVLLEDDALPAPGQGCVLYAGERVLGGGFIVRS
jgi:tRNA-specific 2-thiouridylase